MLASALPVNRKLQPGSLCSTISALTLCLLPGNKILCKERWEEAEGIERKKGGHGGGGFCPLSEKLHLPDSHWLSAHTTRLPRGDLRTA